MRRLCPLVLSTLVACMDTPPDAPPDAPIGAPTPTASIAPITATAASLPTTSPARKKNRLGMNGEGFFRNLTSYDLTWLADLDTTIVLRVPGGGDSKLAHPAPPATGVKGWGLREAEILAYFDTYLPGPGEAFADTCAGPPGASCTSNWCGKGLTKTTSEREALLDKLEDQDNCDPATQLDGLMTCNFLEKLVLLDEVLDLEVVWVANVMSGTAEATAETVAALDYLVAHGVKIAAVELGNEAYFPVNLDWDFGCYRDRAIALIDAIRAAHPRVPISLGAATFEAGEEPPSLQSAMWNDGLAAFLPSPANTFTHDGVTRRGATAVSVHYYLTEDQCPEAWALRPDYSPGDFDDPDYFAGWDEALLALAACDAYGEALAGEVEAARARFPAGTELLVTEMNIKEASAFGDTLVHGAWLFEQLTRVAPDTRLMLVQNGVANELYGLTSRYRGRVDGSDPVELDGIPLSSAYNVRRLGYFAFDLAARAYRERAEPLPTGTLHPGPGATSYWYVNLTPGARTVPAVVSAGYAATFSWEAVVGAAPHSSAGYAAWNAEHASTPGGAPFDFNTISSITSGATNVLPPWSFGVLKIEVSLAEVPDDASPGVE